MNDGNIPEAMVLCAFPLSGQYGPGSRLLYYALVVISIFARRNEWIRNACLAAALLLPAVSSIHALLLATYSAHGAVDLDIFGAFQIIAIGVLAAPITIRYSRTYMNLPGKNLVFVWILLNLAGLLSLAVAFYRAEPHPCLDNNDQPMSVDLFSNLTANATLAGCRWTLECYDLSFVTPIRQDPNNRQEYIRAPTRGMTIDTATLLSAACCIPAVIQVFFTWQKVLEAKVETNPGPGEPGEAAHVSQSQSIFRRNRRASLLNSVETALEHRRMEEVIRRGLGLVERLFFSICILTIVFLGENNLWSTQMRTGTEPMSSIGQWGPILGAILTALGSAYVSVTNSSLPQEDSSLELSSRGPGSQFVNNTSALDDSESAGLPVFRATPAARTPSPSPKDVGGRMRFAAMIVKLTAWFGTPTPTLPEQDLRLYRGYPETPGEELRSPLLGHERDTYRRLSDHGRSEGHPRNPSGPGTPRGRDVSNHLSLTPLTPSLA